MISLKASLFVALIAGALGAFFCGDIASFLGGALLGVITCIALDNRNTPSKQELVAAPAKPSAVSASQAPDAGSVKLAAPPPILSPRRGLGGEMPHETQLRQQISCMWKQYSLAYLKTRLPHVQAMARESLPGDWGNGISCDSVDTDPDNPPFMRLISSSTLGGNDFATCDTYKFTYTGKIAVNASLRVPVLGLEPRTIKLCVFVKRMSLTLRLLTYYGKSSLRIYLGGERDDAKVEVDYSISMGIESTAGSLPEIPLLTTWIRSKLAGLLIDTYCGEENEILLRDSPFMENAEDEDCEDHDDDAVPKQATATPASKAALNASTPTRARKRDVLLGMLKQIKSPALGGGVQTVSSVEAQKREELMPVSTAAKEKIVALTKVAGAFAQTMMALSGSYNGARKRLSVHEENNYAAMMKEVPELRMAKEDLCGGVNPQFTEDAFKEAYISLARRHVYDRK